MTMNAEEQPLNVDVRNGEVVMTGPRVAIALQPTAASETARRLVAAADRAMREAREACAASVQMGDGPASNDA